MKTTTVLKTFSVCVTLFSATAIPASAAEPSYADQVAGKPLFLDRLVWVGPQAPPETESAELLKAIGVFESSGVDKGLAALEKFLSEHPQSAWAPSLEINMAGYYRLHGRYTPALKHWENAWAATKGSQDATGRKLAVQAIAAWTRLLASLGQKDKVTTLFAELDALQLPLGSYGTTIEGTKEGVIVMNGQPGVSYRCGSYALSHMAEAMHLDPKIKRDLAGTDSPDGGFHLSQLLLLAKTNGIDVEAVRRPAGAEIIVPSVVHWKLNHYAAITEKKDGRYRVVDPTFGGHIWMDAETIDSEASAAFLIPKGKAPAPWARLTPAECAVIYGKGYPLYMNDDDDDVCCECGDDCDDDDEDDPPAANDGPGDGTGTDCPRDAGMPQWFVSEPYATLWLKDTPLLYRTSDGKWMKLQLRYKHRGIEKPGSIGSFGPQWECNWLEFMQDNGSDVLTNYQGRGGLRPHATDGTPDYKRAMTFQRKVLPGNGSGGQAVPVTTAPAGATRAYGFGVGAQLGPTNYFLTHRTDRYGRSILFGYDSSGFMTRLTNVVDRDTRSCTISYNGSNLITAVTDPYGRTAHFGYDGDGRLTTITDAVGIVSRFEYDTSNFITNMITPYGSTRFETFFGSSSGAFGNSVRRALRVTEPTGDKQLYAYCANGPELEVSSYHWNRAQYAAISDTGKASPLEMPNGDYYNGRLKMWLWDQYSSTPSDTIAIDYLPASDFNSRVLFGYYTHQGSDGEHVGTLKRVVSFSTALGNLNIERNSLGRPTVLIYNEGSHPAGYTNTFDSSGRYLQSVRGPNGEWVRRYGHHPVITNLLTSVTNALNEVLVYTHDTNNMKVIRIDFPSGIVRSNIYYSSGTSKGFLFKRIDDGIRTNFFGYLNGNLVAETNELGLVTTYIYDNLNRLVSTAYPDGTTVSNVYDNLDLIAVKDRLNQWTHYGYNTVRQLVAVTNVNNQVTLYDYCSCGSPSTITRFKGTTPVVTSFSYDTAGNLTNVIYPDGYQLNYTYNEANLVNTVKDNAGHELGLAYLLCGQDNKIQQVTLGGQNLLINDYDEYGRLMSTIDRNGVTVTNGYDLLSRLIRRQVSDGSAGPETFAYDSTGLTNYTDALGNATRFVRDSAGRVLFETNANNEVLRFTYNAADQLLTLTDGNTNTTTWKYDTFGRVTNKLDQAGTEVFRYKYDPLDRLTNRWSAAKLNTFYKYDPIGNLTNVIYPTSSNIVLRYDTLNRLTNMVDGVGSTLFTWTDGDQLASEDGPWADDTVSYSFDHRLRSALNLAQPNASDWTQSYVYDTVMRLTNVVSAAGSFAYHYYDYMEGFAAVDRVSEILLPAHGEGYNLRILNTYDGLMRLTDTTLENYPYTLNRHEYTYDSGSQRTQQVFTAENSISHYVNYTYDPIGQLKTAKGYEADDTPRLQEQLGYAYDAGWNLSQRTNNTLVQTFNVNSVNELTSATRSGSFTVAGTATEPKGGYYYPGSPPGVTNVTVSGTGLSSGAAELYLDGAWARTNATLANGNNSYTATAQDTYGRTSQDAVSVNLPATSTFVYDLNGNLRTNNTRIFDYDDENQLIRVTEPGAWKSEFVYDGWSRRRINKEYTWAGSTWVKTNETRYAYDGRLVVQERDANNLPLVSYTYGMDSSNPKTPSLRNLQDSFQTARGLNGVAARTENAQLLTGRSSAHSYYHCDGNGSVTALANTNGIVVARYAYDPYGRILSMSGPMAGENRRRFSSKELHSQSGFYDFGFRFYVAGMQRWLNRDPIGEAGGLNLYAYVRNHVPNWSDLFGLAEEGGKCPDAPKGQKCYQYATGRSGPGSDVLGYGDGKDKTTRAQPPFDCDSVRRAAIIDGLTPVPEDGNCPSGSHKVAYAVDQLNGKDYHWLHQVDDQTWCHKFHGQSPSNTDADKQPITNPEKANLNYPGTLQQQASNYKVCENGYLCAPDISK